VGLERKVCVFDASRPGRECEHRPTKKTKKSKEGQHGILSCIAFNPDFSGYGLVEGGVQGVGSDSVWELPLWWREVGPWAGVDSCACPCTCTCYMCVCMAVAPRVYAVGSYSGTTCLYSERDGKQVCELQCQPGGVTHVVFAPNGSYLFTGEAAS
jgi:WD40 repeat protein